MNDLPNKLKDPREALKILGIETPENPVIPFAPGMQPVLPDNYNELAQNEADSQEDILPDDYNQLAQEEANSMEEEDGISKPSSSMNKLNTSVPSLSPPPSKESDILSRYKDLIAQRERDIGAGQETDKSNQFADTIMKGSAKMANAFANRSGRTNINNLPESLLSDKAKQAETKSGRGIEAVLTEFKLKQQQDASKLAAERAKIEDKYKQDMLQLQKDRMASAERIAASKIKGKGMTKGQEKLDQEYAKEYNDYTSKGRSNAINAISKLKEVTSQLKSESGFGGAGGGAIASLLPDAAREDKSIKMRDAAITSANSALKELFGAQLSDSEREAAAKEFYNDRLSNEDNIETINRKIKELESTLKNKDEKAKEFMNKGTLSTFQPQTNLPMPDETPAKSSSPAVGSIINAKGKRYRVVDKAGNLEEVK